MPTEDACGPAALSESRRRSILRLMTVTLFVVAGAIHYQTPMLGALALEFGATAPGWVASCTFGGFLVGMLFVVPLGDRYDRRKLILWHYLGLIIALLAAALAPSLALLSLACVGIGLGSSLGQNVVPMTAEYSPAENRARTLGTVLMGMFFGILFARLSGGLIAASLGWRWSFVLAALLCLLLAPALWRILPSSTPRTRMPYWSLIASLFGILGQYAELRRVAANQFFIGISYGGFWSTVAPMLLAFHALGPSEAGLMAIPGAAGVLISRAAGRWSDRSGASIVATAALCSVLLSFSVLELAAHWLLAVVLGAMLLDFGLRAAMVANQTLVNSIQPDARSRFNTIFGLAVWSGNATGAALASLAFREWGWSAVCALSLSASVIALLLQWLDHRRHATAGSAT